jgi:hypothetical protein
MKNGLGGTANMHLQLQKLFCLETIEIFFSDIDNSVDPHSNRDAIIHCEAIAALAEIFAALL